MTDIKLRPLGPTNLIYNDSYSDDDVFGPRSQSDSKSDDNFGFWLYDDVN